MHAIRYLVDDVRKATAFYTGPLGFALKEDWGPVTVLTRDGLELWVSGPASSAGKTAVDGRQPAPGGSNRIALVVKDLAALVEKLKKSGVKTVSETVTGPAGSWVVVSDPAGNPVELFEPK